MTTQTDKRRDRTKRQPTPRRNGHPRASVATADEPAADARAAALDGARAYTPSPGRRAKHWAIAVLVSAAHAVTVPVVASQTGDLLFTMAWLMAPAWATIWLVPGARTTGYHRWLAVLFLANVVEPFWQLPVLIAADAWVIHRFWFVEFPGTSKPAVWLAKRRERAQAREPRR